MKPPRSILQRLRSAARSTLNGFERTMHRWRHRRSVQRLRDRLPVRRVIFVCLGNICRSPYAERRLEEHLERRLETHDFRRPDIRSAGFINPGTPSPEVACTVARARGLSLDGHRATVIGSLDPASGDCLIAMTSEQCRRLRSLGTGAEVFRLGDLDPGPISRRDVEDPYGHDSERFHAVYSRIDRAVTFLSSEIIGALVEASAQEL